VKTTPTHSMGVITSKRRVKGDSGWCLNTRGSLRKPVKGAKPSNKVCEEYEEYEDRTKCTKNSKSAKIAKIEQMWG
jgi:hypothetical protein